MSRAVPLIVFLTCNREPDLQPGDRPVAAALEAAGVRVEARPWNGPADALAGAELAVVRSTWDYWDHIDDFRAFLGALDGAPIVNSARLLRWNLNKRYLRGLIMKGAPMALTRFAAPAAADLGAAIDALGAREVVIKPVIDAGAAGLSRVAAGDAAGLARAAARLNGRAAIVQPVIEAIAELGETSFVFFDGAFSHAVNKRPRAGDIRIQSQHGGVYTRVEPASEDVASAARVLAMLPEPPLYARIDAIIDTIIDPRAGEAAPIVGGRLDERFRLMEVEIIEPDLYFTQAPDAAPRFAAALMKRLGQTSWSP